MASNDARFQSCGLQAGIEVRPERSLKPLSMPEGGHQTVLRKPRRRSG